MANHIKLDNISIVLQRPRFPENIGAAARAMRNMGIRHLLVVNPENYDKARVLKMATHAALDAVEQIKFYDTLKDALAGFNHIIGTTARLGGQRQAVSSPLITAEKLIPISQKNSVAILFGPEDRGLSNEDIRLCHTLVNIPTADFSSLNLAQAVMVMCYSLYTAATDVKQEFAPRLANRHELDGMYEQLKDILVRISYINPENPDYWMNKLRLFFNRLHLRAREVSIIRGICRQIDWYGKKCRQEGEKGRSNK